MIRLFSSTDKVFTSNGDVVLNPTKAIVHKEDNGDYYLDIEMGLEYVDYIVEGNIIVAPTPTGDQAFRIGNVTKKKSKISTRCYHVFYDSENYLIVDSYVVNKTCAEALAHLNNATEPVSEFTTSSDVSHVDSFRCVRKSLYEAVQTVLERWGGHLVRDNFGSQIKSSSTLIKGLLIQTLPPISKPLVRTTREEIDGRDGDIITKLGYSAYDKQMQIGLFGDYDIDEVIEYFNTEGTVIFSNEPDKFYYYQIIEQIDFEKLIRFKTATVTFHVQPFKYSAVDDAILESKNKLSVRVYSVQRAGVTITAENGIISVLDRHFMTLVNRLLRVIQNLSN